MASMSRKMNSASRMYAPDNRAGSRLMMLVYDNARVRPNVYGVAGGTPSRGAALDSNLLAPWLARKRPRPLQPVVRSLRFMRPREVRGPLGGLARAQDARVPRSRQTGRTGTVTESRFR